MNDNEKQLLSAMMAGRKRPQILYVDNGKAFSAPFPQRKTERVYPSPIDRGSLDGLKGFTRRKE
jgi:hypothetical protein